MKISRFTAWLLSISAFPTMISAQSEAPYTIIPDPALPQTGISYIRVAFPPIDQVELLLTAGGTNLDIIKPDGSTIKVNGDWINYDAGQVIGYTLDEPLSEPGVYSLSIATGIFNESVGDWVPPVEFTYTLIPDFSSSVSISPAPGSYRELSGDVTIAINGAAEVNTADGTKISVTNNGTTKEYPLSANGNQLSFSFGDQTLSYGSHVVKLPAESISAQDAGGKAMEIPAAEWVYTIPDMNYEFSPKPGTVKSLWDIRMTFPGALMLDLKGEPEDITLTDPEGQPVDAVNFVMSNYLYVRVDANQMPEGKYTLDIPAGTLMVDGIVFEDPLTAEYTINKNTAVEGVSADSVSDGFIYTPDGICHGKAAINNGNLEKGLYIINGKKVIVK